MWPHFFSRGELILEVYARRAGLDHRLHELESVERPAEARLGVGDDGEEPIVLVFAFRAFDLVGAHQRGVDLLDDVGNAVDRVKALVGVHLAGRIGVGGDLPAAEVDGLEARARHLHRLVAGEGAERGDVVLVC